MGCTPIGSATFKDNSGDTVSIHAFKDDSKPPKKYISVVVLHKEEIRNSLVADPTVTEPKPPEPKPPALSYGVATALDGSKDGITITRTPPAKGKPLPPKDKEKVQIEIKLGGTTISGEISLADGEKLMQGLR